MFLKEHSNSGATINTNEGITNKNKITKQRPKKKIKIMII